MLMLDLHLYNGSTPILHIYQPPRSGLMELACKNNQGAIDVFKPEKCALAGASIHI